MHAWVVFLLLALAAAAAPARSPSAFAFALIGDAPYSAFEAAEFEQTIAAINADPAIRFVLHVGDIKGGRESCSDELLRARFAQLQQLRPALIYTPGDNEWTDCHRGAAGGFNPLERLAFVRRLFFPRPDRSTGGTPMAVTPQSATAAYAEFVENVRFSSGSVLFFSLHVVGSNNDLLPWHGIDRDDSFTLPRADRAAAYARREAANLAWIDASFAQARAGGAAAVVLLMQANPRFDYAPSDARRAGFNAVLERIGTRAREFGRPVLIAHGDFHDFLVDRPYDGENGLPKLPQITRVQTFGSPRLHWIRVSVDAARVEPFLIEPQILPPRQP